MAKGKRNKKSTKYSKFDEWTENQDKRDEVVSTNVDINVGDLKGIPVGKEDESKALIKDGIKIDTTNQLESIRKEKIKSSSLLNNPGTQTKVELDVSKTKNKEVNNDSNSSKKKKSSNMNLVNSENKVNLDNNDKLEHDHKLEATSSISKNGRKPTLGESSEKKNPGKYKNDRKESLNESDLHGEQRRANKNSDKKAKHENKKLEKTPSIQKAKAESHEVQPGISKTDHKSTSIRHTNEERIIDPSHRHEKRNTSVKNDNHRKSYKEQNPVDDDQKNLGRRSKNKSNNEFNWQKIDHLEYQPTIETENDVLIEKDENLFNLSKDTPIAHCVAEDLRMGAGIAVEFKRYFSGVGKLIDQKLVVGNVGVVKRHDQIAFYLITKKFSYGKPTMSTLHIALQSLLQKMKELNLTKLGIPRIGCGLDGLDWDSVKELILNVFTRSGIHIIVCIPSKILDKKPASPLKVYITPKNIWDMVAYTTIILLIDLDQLYKENWMNDVAARVNSRYPFKEKLLNDIKNKKFKPGEITQYVINKEKIICVFTSETSYYSNLEKAFVRIKNSDESYQYFALQSGQIGSAENFKHISWVVLILRSIINKSELWLTGDIDIDQSQENVLYDQYCKTVLQNMRNYSSNFNSSGQMNYNEQRYL